jgi:two-component system C4-dicarboxylate transport sensor histidine kinase DctB
MRNYADNALLMIDSGRAEGVRGNLQRIGALTERMGHITSHLRAHARKQPEPIGPVSVRAAVDNALSLLQAPAGDAPAPTVDIQPAGLAVMAEPVRLEQVLVNLLRNANEASQGAAAPAIVATADGAWVRIRVRDHGKGIAPEVLAQLFEPFFTTKPAGSGLGLGLAVSRMIVRGLGGELQAGNAATGGAEFTVDLPQAALPMAGPVPG